MKVSKELTSIIMTCFDQTQTMRHISMLAVADITRYTDPKDYELIIVDTLPKYPFRDDYKVLKIDKFIEIKNQDPGYYECMNIGVKKVKGDYLCFIENDVLIKEGWLDTLKWYLENDFCDAIMPDQIPTTYEKMKKYQRMSYEEAFGQGAIEAGLLLIGRNAFGKIGTWDKTWTGKLPTAGWKRIYQQINEAGLRLGQTAKTTISHITGVTEYFNIENK